MSRASHICAHIYLRLARLMFGNMLPTCGGFHIIPAFCTPPIFFAFSSYGRARLTYSRIVKWSSDEYIYLFMHIIYQQTIFQLKWEYLKMMCVRTVWCIAFGGALLYSISHVRRRTPYRKVYFIINAMCAWC